MHSGITNTVPEHKEGELITEKPGEKMPVKKITTETVQKARTILDKYKAGKKNLEDKIVENEQWWKLRHWEQTRKTVKKGEDEKADNDYIPATGWLFNVITSKHADMEDAYPEPNILPREEGDIEEAKKLSSIIPVVLEQNDFHSTYSDCCWYKLKQGAAIYGVFWDATKHNGLGDISIKKIDAINLFWEPGITDIQKSKHLFHVELVDNDVLMQKYPQLKDKTLGGNSELAKYIFDDAVDTSEKSEVIDWYYHTNYGGKTQLHYCKFVGDTVLYATENETDPVTEPAIDPETGEIAVNPETGSVVTRVIKKSIAETGWYDHGLYPFVIDSLFDIEGSPFGYGYTDICKDTQVSIDNLNNAIVRNALMASKPRYFATDSCNVNLEEFADWEKEIVHVTTMSEETLREIKISSLSGTYVEFLNNQISMLKETSGNRDVNNGGTQSGVTAASALAVLQEAGNKGSRDNISTTYIAMNKITFMVIELIRQFYDVPRQFRILGAKGATSFIPYDNSRIKPQPQGTDFDMDMGFRVPEFDIKVTAQKASPYNKLSQNELALQFYQLQFFNPQNTTQALACLEMMDFDGKDDVMATVQNNGTLLQAFTALLQLAMGMAQAHDPAVLPAIMQNAAMAGIAMPAPTAPAGERVQTDSTGAIKPEEHAFVKRARKNAQSSTQPR